MLTAAECGKQLEAQPLRRLETLLRWMDDVGIPDDMRALLLECIEDLRDLALWLVAGSELNSRTSQDVLAARLALRSPRGKVALMQALRQRPPPETGLDRLQRMGEQERLDHYRHLPQLVDEVTDQELPSPVRPLARRPEALSLSSAAGRAMSNLPQALLDALSSSVATGEFVMPPPEQEEVEALSGEDRQEYIQTAETRLEQEEGDQISSMVEIAVLELWEA